MQLHIGFKLKTIKKKENKSNNPKSTNATSTYLINSWESPLDPYMSCHVNVQFHKLQLGNGCCLSGSCKVYQSKENFTLECSISFQSKSELPFFNTTTTTPQCRKRLSIHNTAQTANKGAQFCTSRNLPLFRCFKMRSVNSKGQI